MSNYDFHAHISVIVPVYKVEPYLHRCVDSILAQTYKDFELILVDDGSPDKCGVICDEYASKDRRVVVIHLENGGLSAARNAGIDWAFENSDSDWLTFVDSDDWVTTDYLHTLLTAAQYAGTNISVGNHRYVDKYESKTDCDNTNTIKVMTPEEFIVGETRRYNFAWAKLYRKQCFNMVRYPNGKNFEDVFTTYKMLFACEKIAVVDKVIIFYFNNPESITRATWSPSELVILDGTKEQLMFYKKNGFQKAVEVTERRLLWNYTYQITRVSNSNLEQKEKNKYIKLLRREMINYIRNSSGKFNFNNSRECYIAAYPKIMAIYNYGAKLYRKIRK